MSPVEITTTATAIIAISISIVSLYNSFKTSKKMIDFEAIHAEVSKLQLQKHEDEEKRKNEANLHIELQTSRGSGKFLIENKGPATAKNIYFTMTEKNDHNPLVGRDYNSKTPYPTLNGGESFYLLASFSIDNSQSIYEISLRWNNADGSQKKRIYSVSR